MGIMHKIELRTGMVLATAPVASFACQHRGVHLNAGLERGAKTAAEWWSDDPDVRQR